MEIIKLKGCKRCGGDLILDQDYAGSYVSCLQCSAVYVKNQITKEKKPPQKRTYAR
jgi:DNA-directed RNA polymerase subunit RPC12/RpoP